jgi:methylmalonyl-CoA/ethylmalonyl-CoA epimerase
MNEQIMKVNPALPQEHETEASLRFHHLGIAVSSLERAIPIYADIFGYRVQSGPFEDPLQKVKICFLGKEQREDTFLELVAPLAGNTPITRILAKGGGAYHLCFETSDIEKKLAEVAGKGCVIVSAPVPAVAFDGRRIAWFFTPTNQLVELVEAEHKPQKTGSSGVK